MLVAALVGVALAAATSAYADDANAVHYYLSLGDSLASGPQAGGDADNYADQLFAGLGEQDATLRLVKLACGGETTHSMIFTNPCGYTHGSQLDEATSLLHAHGRFVRLVTIDIGANDVLLCIFQLDPGCLDATLPSVATNLATILTALRDAAGPHVPIVGMNYYDPFSPLVRQPGWGSAQRADGGAVQRRARVRLRAGPRRRRGRLSTTEFTPRPPDGIPLNVLRICQWTRMCTSSPNVHPNTAGNGVIAKTFVDVLP
jgi:lysophospholipase L1-like esterase